MRDDAVVEFWKFVKKDAAVQERVLLAAKQQEPLLALGQVAAGAGFALTAAELRGSLGGELSDDQLEAATGGVAAGPTTGGINAASLIEARVLSMRAPAEWFAE